MAKQPTATAFTRTQQSWAEHVLGRIREDIDKREDYLLGLGWDVDELDRDDELCELYDDELFWERFSAEMEKQREYIREKYLGG